MANGKINQQDGITDDNTGQSDKANHRGGGKLGIEQPVARNDPDQGQGYRRHDDPRNHEVAELPYHQDIDEDQCHTKGGTHVTEGLIGHRPFAGPLKGGFSSICRCTEVFAGDDFAIGSDVLIQFCLDIEHAVDWRGEPANGFAHYIFDGAQILMENDRILLFPDKLPQLGKRDGGAIGCRYRQVSQACDLGTGGKWNL